MSQEINQRIIKLNKTANIDKELQIGHDYTIKGIANCRKREDSDNDNGTIDRFFKLWLTGELEIEDDLGESFKARVRGSQSQAWRVEVIKLGEEYEKIMSIMLEHPEEVIEFLKKLNEKE